LNYIPSTTVGFCPIGAVETGTGQTSGYVINQIATTPAAANMTVTASPASIVGNGTSTSTITATVTTATAAPVPGDVVAFAVATNGGGTVSPQFATTNASGVATTTYTSSTLVGPVTVGATEANAGISHNTTVTQTAPPNVVTLAASPTSVPANGTSTSTLTVTSTNGNGTPGAGQAVVISSTGTCGTISGPAGLTNASGTYSTTYQAGNTSGFCTISATSGGTAAGSPAVIDQTSNPVPNPPNTITASATPSTIVGNGSSQSTIAVQVLASNSTPVNGDPVSFLLSGAGCGTLSSAAQTTNAAGQASVTYTSKAAAGSCTITVAEANSGATGSTTVTQTAAQNSVVVSPATKTLIDDGLSTQVFTANVAPALLGGSVANDTVTWTLSGSPSAACGTINPSSGNTGAGTTVSAVYQSSTTSGFCTVTATESATGASGTALVDQTLNPTPITYTTTTTATPASIPGDGVSTSTISTKVLNTGAVPVVGDTVRFTETGANIGTLSSAYAVTDATGTASVTYTSSKNSTAVATITGTEANAGTSAMATVTQTTPPNVITVGANPQLVSPSATSAITVTVTKAGVPQSGDAITFSWSGAGCLSPPVNPLGGTTLANGTLTATYTAPPATGSGSLCTLTAGDASPASGSVQIINTAS
jgi:adhesin/invasin